MEVAVGREEMKHSQTKIKKHIPKLLQRGHLPVGDGHELYYELRGNPNGKLMVLNKGGPGGSIKRKDFYDFNGDKYKLLFYDQRGCGKSTYEQLLYKNTTQDLVEDLKKLIEHVGEKQAIVVGGSWGSTISLCFAIAYPQMVRELRISGVFLEQRMKIIFKTQLSFTSQN